LKKQFITTLDADTIKYLKSTALDNDTYVNVIIEFLVERFRQDKNYERKLKEYLNKNKRTHV